MGSGKGMVKVRGLKLTWLGVGKVEKKSKTQLQF